jgi:glutamine synthetase
MPKPLSGENGSACTRTCRCSRTAATSSSTHDQYHLPPAGKQFIAGLLHRPRARPLARVNSYKRRGPGDEAPVYVAWSQRNRSALVRILLYKPGPSRPCAELRCRPPATRTSRSRSARGLEGIEKGYSWPTRWTRTCPPHRRGGRAAASSPSQTLGEAVDEFAGSDLMRRAFVTTPSRPWLRAQGWDEASSHAVGAGQVLVHSSDYTAAGRRASQGTWPGSF